jgi:hypothetical protein
MTGEASAVLVTGGTGRIGRVLVLGFSRLGWDVAFSSRNSGAAAGLERECLDAGARRAMCVGVDLGEQAAAASVMRALADRGFEPHVLVNNARNLDHLEVEPDGRTSRANWIAEFVLGVVAPYELSMALAALPGASLRTIVNVASMYGVVAPNLGLYGSPDRESAVNYGVTKAALIHLTKELAVRLAPRGITVNAVSFGGVAGRAGEAFVERYRRLCPSGRMLNDADLFGPVKFLASPDASGATGHNLVVDGGWTAW